MVCYELRKLKDHEKSYAVHDLELVAIVLTLKMWRHYLLRKRFLLKMDNIGLKYLFDQQNLNVR